MEYVMVPVPEEHVEAVQNFIMFRAATSEVDDATIERLYRESDELSRHILSLVATSIRSEERIAVPLLARLVERSEREVVGTMVEINNRAQALEADAGAVLAIGNSNTGADVVGWDARVVGMTAKVADSVLATSSTAGSTATDDASAT